MLNTALPERCRHLAARIAVAAMLPVLVFVPGSQSIAQGLSSLSDSGSDAVVILERDDVEQRSLAAFRRQAEAHARAAQGRDTGDEATARMRDVAGETVGYYEQNLASLLDHLESDGILTAGEVSTDVQALYDEHFDYLDAAVRAVEDGSEPPPFRRNYDSVPAYSRAMASYTLLERNGPADWALLFGILAAGALGAGLLNSLARRLAAPLAERGYTGMAKILESLAGPLYLAVLALSLDMALEGIWIPGAIYEFLRTVIEVALVAAFFWLLWNASVGGATAVSNVVRTSYEREFNSHTRSILVRVLRMLVITGLVITLLRYVFDTDLQNLLAGLGILGIALYFMLRGTMQNIAASFTLYGDKPFRVGDLVIWNDDWGQIEDIGFRSTRFRTLDGHLVTIPNSELIETSIENAGARPFIRRRFHVALRFETPPEKIREAIDILRDILDGHEGQPEDFPPHVAFETIGADQQSLLVQYYYEPPDYWEALAFDTEVNLAILERFDEAGIAMAFPTQTQQLEVEAPLHEKFERLLAQHRDS
jgi:MscS family membrane protein